MRCRSDTRMAVVQRCTECNVIDKVAAFAKEILSKIQTINLNMFYQDWHMNGAADESMPLHVTLHNATVSVELVWNFSLIHTSLFCRTELINNLRRMKNMPSETGLTYKVPWDVYLYSIGLQKYMICRAAQRIEIWEPGANWGPKQQNPALGKGF